MGLGPEEWIAAGEWEDMSLLWDGHQGLIREVSREARKFYWDVDKEFADLEKYMNWMKYDEGLEITVGSNRSIYGRDDILADLTTRANLALKLKLQAQAQEMYDRFKQLPNYKDGMFKAAFRQAELIASVSKNQKTSADETQKRYALDARYESFFPPEENHGAANPGMRRVREWDHPPGTTDEMLEKARKAGKPIQQILQVVDAPQKEVAPLVAVGWTSPSGVAKKQLDPTMTLKKKFEQERHWDDDHEKWIWVDKWRTDEDGMQYRTVVSLDFVKADRENAQAFSVVRYHPESRMLGPFAKITGESDHLALSLLSAMGYEFQYVSPIGGFGYGLGAYSEESGKPRLHHGLFRPLVSRRAYAATAERAPHWSVIMKEKNVSRDEAELIEREIQDEIDERHRGYYMGLYSPEQWADWNSLMDVYKVPLEHMPPMYQIRNIHMKRSAGAETHTYMSASGKLTELNFFKRTVRVKTWEETEHWKQQVLADGLGPEYVKMLREWGIPRHTLPQMMNPDEIKHLFRAEHRTIDREIKEAMSAALAARLDDLEQAVCL